MLWKTTAVLLGVVVVAGCSNRVYFGTSTRFAMDVSSTTLGLGYKSAQFAHVPPREGGGEFSVLGNSDVDLSMMDLVIEEQFATGQAAECAAADGAARSLAGERSTGKKGSLIFGSYNSVSLLDVNFGAVNPFAGGSIGYKRETATVIPIVEKNHLRSVYANNRINSQEYSAENTKGTRTQGIRFHQVFATGNAAILIARTQARSLSDGKVENACVPQ